MGIPDGAHTHHGHGGGGGGTIVLVVLAAAAVVKLAGPVVAAAGELLRVALIVAGVILGLGAVGLVALIAVRVRQRVTITIRAVKPLSPRVRRRPAPLGESLPAIERPQEIHLHLHGISAEDIAAILGRQNGHGHG